VNPRGPSPADKSSDLAPVNSWSGVGVESIFIPNGYSALLTEDGRGLLTPDGYVLAMADGSAVFVPLAEREPSLV
jgi:hypothetical protein